MNVTLHKDDVDIFEIFPVVQWVDFGGDYFVVYYRC